MKIAQMGPEGFLLKDYMYIQMWTDVEKRLKSLEVCQCFTGCLRILHTLEVNSGREAGIH